MTSDTDITRGKNDKTAEPERGRLFIISAPSGAGKTSLCGALMKHFDGMLYSISYTTREPRKGEKDGVDYHFISKDYFEKQIDAGTWAEWAEVHGNYYGTSAVLLDKAIASGNDILLDIDVEGTKQIIGRYPDSITIFIMPPSLDILRFRMESRGADSKEVIERRMINAEKEMSQKSIYKHVIVNDNLPKAVAELISTVEMYRKGMRGKA
ncbi:MAG: guanylate kinase [Proteobacteria bacterium]|nr:guanylate kinase [Pseudomonadota bacterium]MBU1570723.1 guanylate kinase [Pseudomonadota bacterium]